MMTVFSSPFFLVFNMLYGRIIEEGVRPSIKELTSKGKLKELIYILERIGIRKLNRLGISRIQTNLSLREVKYSAVLPLSKCVLK
ncbi:transcriptional regulator, AsnC family [Neobacillus massiliamazoniensis]|uniref:Transcriptional regulator, AsnC family n=1 Tax=Neobacillus massiliamazoniensis TaxID=1499688 RepID=A0A0U1NYL9_9BACI|nr:transcriptional regulator, AsnC family [Neobacillus massiliamazoniensis]